MSWFVQLPEFPRIRHPSTQKFVSKSLGGRASEKYGKKEPTPNIQTHKELLYRSERQPDVGFVNGKSIFYLELPVVHLAFLQPETSGFQT